MEKPSGLNRIRTAIGALAALGAVSGTELPRDGGLPQMQQAEAAEALDVNKEAEAFLDEIASLKIGINNIHDEFELRRRIEDGFSEFVLALKLQKPLFSKKETGRFMGMIGPEERTKAAILLQQKLQERNDKDNPALKILEKEIGWGRET